MARAGRRSRSPVVLQVCTVKCDVSRVWTAQERQGSQMLNAEQVYLRQKERKGRSGTGAKGHGAQGKSNRPGPGTLLCVLGGRGWEVRPARSGGPQRGHL